MKLYHGTIHEFVTPDPSKGHDGTDFGPGFYLTESESMADDWHKGEPNKHVNVYDVSLNKVKACELKFYRFLTADIEWAKFVYKNRKGKDSRISYDVIIGPLADNGLNKWFNQIDNKEITWDELAQGINFDRYRSLQFCFKTPDSVNLLEYETRK